MFASNDLISHDRKKIDVFSKDILIIPVHLNIHWCCAIVNFKLKRFEYYDSMHGRNVRVFELMKTYLKSESQDKRKQELDLDEWESYSPQVYLKLFVIYKLNYLL